MTRDEILEAAAQIFREKGFHAASMQDIAEAVNLQKASLYYHVTSKQEILLDLLDRALDLLIQIIEPVTCSALPPDQKVRRGDPRLPAGHARQPRPGGRTAARASLARAAISSPPYTPPRPL